MGGGETRKGVSTAVTTERQTSVCGGGGGGDNRDKKRPLWITERQTGGHEQGYQSDGQ